MTTARRVILLITLLVMVVGVALVVGGYLSTFRLPWEPTSRYDPFVELAEKMPQPWHRRFWESGYSQIGMALTAFAVVFGVLGFAIFKPPVEKP